MDWPARTAAVSRAVLLDVLIDLSGQAAHHWLAERITLSPHCPSPHRSPTRDWRALCNTQLSLLNFALACVGWGDKAALSGLWACRSLHRGNVSSLSAAHWLVDGSLSTSVLFNRLFKLQASSMQTRPIPITGGDLVTEFRSSGLQTPYS